MTERITRRQWLKQCRGPKSSRTKRKPPDLEGQMMLQFQAAGIEPSRRDVKLNDKQPRRWRYDFIFDAQKVIMEVEGGTYAPNGGRHTTGKGFNSDCHKYAYAMLCGYMVLRVDSVMVKDGSAIDYLEKLLKLIG